MLVSSNVAYTIDDITDSVSLVAKFLDRPINIATIVNSDFESEELDGWSINSNTTGTIVNTESHSGSNSLNLSFEGTGYKHTYLSLNVNANKEYKIRFYAKSNTASPCYLQVLHTSKYTDASNGGVVFINPFAVGNSAAWNEYYLTIPSDNPSEKIYLDFYSNNTSFDVYIDDITVAVEKNITVSTDISSDTNKGYVTFANQYGEVSETQDAVYLYGDTVTAIAHPDSANKLLGWKLSGENEYLSTEESYSFVLEEDTNLVAEFGFDGLGDIDGDNRLTAADLTLMRKMLLDIDIGTGYIIENRDSNGDGEFDIRDLVSLKKKIVDIDGSEGFYSYNELSGQNGYIKQLSYVNNVYADTSKVGELIELKAHINGITSDLNVFDADDVDHGVDLSITLTKGNKTITMPAFYYKGYDVDENNVVTNANGQNEFRFRFTLPESGEWDFVVTLKVKGVQVDTISNTITVKENSEDKGYIKVSTTDSSRFAYEDGTLYTPIGQNIAYSTVNSKERGADIIGKMTNIADNGANFVRTWLNPWFLSLQKANKNPNDLSSGMADAIQLDAIFEKATELGVNIQLTLFTHTMFKDSDSSTESGWKDSPYKNIISSPEAFFTDDNAEGQTKDYLRYLVARYGYSQNLFAWELMNEADATTNYSEDAVDAWNTEMASYLKDIDPYKHMVTSSNSQMADASNNEEFNFVSLHYYHSEKGAFDFWDPDYVSSVVNQVEANKLGKPVLFGELGFTENDEVYVDADIMRRQLWVSLMSSAGSGASWLWDNIDVNADISQKYFAVEKFAKLIDFESTEYFNAGLSSIKTYNIIGYKGSDSAYLWMYRESGSNSGTLSYTVNDLSNGTYNISFFDTNSGNVISINSATVTNGNLSITTENFTSDIAVIIEKQ